MEGDGFGFDFTFLHIDFVSAEDDGDILADANKITLKRISMGGTVSGL